LSRERLVLERFLPYRLSVLTNTVSRELARAYADRFGLTIPQWRVVAVLGREEGLSSGEMCERTVMDKVTVSRAVAGLVADGRLLRATDPEDRRRSVLRLSARGRRVYERIVPLARAYERQLLGAFEPDERALLDGLLERLTERASELRDRV
jgi:DNA-binding MarR family transcriptional regulator